MNKELLQQCLDALIESRGDVDLCYAGVKAARLSFRQERQLGFYEEQLIKHDAAIEALKQALAQQEPPGPATPEDMKIYKGIADGYRRDAAQQEPNPWQTAVIDQLVIHHVYQAAHDTDPRKAVHDLLCISNDIALDPQVSSDAQALIDRGGREARQEQPASVDAYVGAREDAAIWKKRALEAEELNRKFIAELNGPTYLGEPVKQEQPAQEPVGRFVKATYGDYGVLAWHPSYVAKIGDCLYTHPAPTQPAQKPDLWKTQFLTDVMTSAGLLMHGRTDKKLAQRIADGSARWRTELYASAPTQPSLSDADIEKVITKGVKSGGISWTGFKKDGKGKYAVPILSEQHYQIARAIEAHCRGDA